MCGIYGITERNKKVIENIIEKCSHRGPDGSGIHITDNLTLGHNLLSITSKSKDGKQPWISERENVLIFNGEIFNYNELINNYKDSFFPRTTCDTELLSWLFDNFEYERVILLILCMLLLGITNLLMKYYCLEIMQESNHYIFPL